MEVGARGLRAGDVPGVIRRAGLRRFAELMESLGPRCGSFFDYADTAGRCGDGGKSLLGPGGAGSVVIGPSKLQLVSQESFRYQFIVSLL